MQRASDKTLVAAAPQRHHRAGHTIVGRTMDSDVTIKAAHAGQEKTALDTPALQPDYDACWTGFDKRFGG